MLTIWIILNITISMSYNCWIGLVVLNIAMPVNYNFDSFEYVADLVFRSAKRLLPICRLILTIASYVISNIPRVLVIL